MSRDPVEQALGLLQHEVVSLRPGFADALRERFFDEALGVRSPKSGAMSPRRRRRPTLLVAAALAALVATVGAVVLVPRPPSALATVAEARARFADLPSLRATVVKVVPGVVLAEEVGEPVPDWTVVTEISFQDDQTWRREIVRDENDPFEPQGQVGSFQVYTPEEHLVFDGPSSRATVGPTPERSAAQSRLEALREMSPSLNQAGPVSDEAIRSCEVLADEEIAGRDAHHLRCTFDAGGDDVASGAEAWLDVDTGVLLKLTFPNGLRFEVTDIQLGVSFPPGTFSTERPEGSSDSSTFDTGLSLGEEVSTWTLPLASGGSLDLASLRGRWSVVYVWATWCGTTCSGGQPEADPLHAVNEAFAQHGAEIGIVALAAADDMTAVADLVERERYTVPIAVAQEPPADLWGGFGVPLLVVIDADGGLAGAYFGDLQGEDIRRILAAVADGEPLPDENGKTEAQLPS